MRRVLTCLGIAVFALLALGFVLLASASGDNAVRLYGEARAMHFLLSQSKWLLFAVPLLLVAAFFDYHNWRRHPALTIAAYVVVCLLMVAVLFCEETKGSHRWIPIGGMKLQPSEMGKIMSVIATAVVIDFWDWRIPLKRAAISTGAVIAVLMGLAVVEPDFGTTAVVAVTGGALLVVGGVKLWQIGAMGAIGAGLVAPLLLTNANRMNRIMAFFAPDAASGDAGHQLKQSLVAFGNGISENPHPFWDGSIVYPWWNALTGLGFTKSMQKHYYLPEAHTDFIYAVGAEELGLVFSLGVLILFVVVFVCGVITAQRATDRLGRLLAYGMSFLIFCQVLLNIGVVTGCLPTKGLALPLMSYGGTNLLATFTAIGVIFNVGRQIELQNAARKSTISAVFSQSRR